MNFLCCGWLILDFILDFRCLNVLFVVFFGNYWNLHKVLKSITFALQVSTSFTASATISAKYRASLWSQFPNTIPYFLLFTLIVTHASLLFSYFVLRVRICVNSDIYYIKILLKCFDCNFQEFYNNSVICHNIILFF